MNISSLVEAVWRAIGVCDVTVTVSDGCTDETLTHTVNVTCAADVTNLVDSIATSQPTQTINWSIGGRVSSID